MFLWMKAKRMTLLKNPKEMTNKNLRWAERKSNNK